MIKSALLKTAQSLSDRLDLNLRLEELPENLTTTILTFGDDVFDADLGYDEVFGLSGDDIIDVRDTVGLDDEAPFFDEDVVYGGGGNDQIQSGVEDDLIYGGKGDDWLRPGTGDDIIVAGEGNDRINGSSGADQIWTGEGQDAVIIRDDTGADKIMDFESGEDVLVINQDWFDFQGLDAPDTGQLGTGGNVSVGDDGTLDAQFYLVYNALAPVLVYDEDGAGAGEAVPVVRLTFNDTIAESDIFIIA